MRISLPRRRTVYCDTETTGLSPWTGDAPYAVALYEGSPEKEKTTLLKYYEWPVNVMDRSVKYDSKDVSEISEILGNSRIVKVFHNSKFDCHMLRKAGVQIRGRIEDTSFAARICNSLETSFKLKDLAWKFFDYPKEDMIGLKEVVKKLRKEARAKGWKVADEAEADYWLCQYVDLLLPKLPYKEKKKIEAMVGVYCVGDVTRTALLWNKYRSDLDSDIHYRDIYEQELELLPIVMSMESRGMAISKKATKKEIKAFSKKRDLHYERILNTASKKGYSKFNPGSSKQLAQLLYTKKGFDLECIKETKSGADSVDWTALRPYYNHYFVRDLMAYRSSVKALDTFFQKYLDMMRPDPITINNSISNYGFEYVDPDVEDINVLHPSLNQCGTVTGRFSCNNPNLQQVANSDTAARGAEPIQARTPFCPRPGYTWYLPDYAQMELRVFADVASVEPMLDAIRNGRDLNTENANRAWGGKGNQYAYEAAALALELGHEEPSKDLVREAWERIGWTKKLAKYGVRSSEALDAARIWLKQYGYDIVKAEKSLEKSGTRGRSKIVTFCKIYGGGPAAVVDMLYCTLEEAKAYWKQYDRAFPEIEAYARAAIQRAHQDGYIITRYGRKLQIDPNYAYRAVNYMIQGTCADLMKSAIRNCHNFLQETGLDAHVLMTVHDELIFEIKNGDNYKWVLREIKKIMEDTEGHLEVPMEVDMKKTKTSWSQKEPVVL